MNSESGPSRTSSTGSAPADMAELLASLTPTERAELDVALGLANPPLWKPFPNSPQEQAVHCQADELFFGGAAGGSKTWLCLGLAVTAHRKTLYLRRESVQLTAAVESLKKIVGSRGSWRGSGHGGIMTVDGCRTVELGGCEHEDDKQKYQGRDHDLKVLDECSHFSRSQVRLLIGWNRTDVVGQRCRVVLAGNPPLTPEGRWIVDEFAPWLDERWHDPAAPGELRYYTYIDDKLTWFRTGEPIYHKGERIVPKSRTFIPARVQDNPVLTATGYISVLQAMPEPIRSQLLFGDFTAGTQDDDYQVIPTAWVRAAQARWTEDGGKGQPLTCVGCDPARGGSDKTVLAPRRGTWVGRLIKRPGKSTPDGTAVVDLIVQETREQPDVPANIDIIGIGASVFDIYRQVRGARPVAVNFATGTNRRDRSGRLSFVNLRAWAYWYLREALDPERGDKLALPPDPELLADLTAPRWEQRASGIIVEPKEAIAKRIGRSPDCGDACVLSIIPVYGWECPSTCANPPHLGGSNPATGERLTGGARLRAMLEQAMRRYSGGVPKNLDPFAGRPSRLTGG